MLKSLCIFIPGSMTSKALELSPEHGQAVMQGWLVTNTRCTSDAIQYAECVGLRIMSWRYPATGSLEKMIEEKRLYPATILHPHGGRPLRRSFETILSSRRTSLMQMKIPF